ncbi:MAG TPA: ABC transporter permease [Gemmatimonadaceae bacterium]|jgi:NitT/TauT family transport system permease protein|nr:ABC transporter permease [Gemmatimonadaceae bacterium]
MIRRTWLPLVLLLVWEIGARVGWIGSALLPPPGEIVAAIADWARDGALIRDALASVGRVSAGFALATILGIGVGSLVALLPVVRRNLLPLIELVRPIPPIAWIPMAILWFGIGGASAVFIVCVGGFFPIMTATMHGIAGVRRETIHTARCLGASRWLTVTDVVLPAALPDILSGLRTGLGSAWMSLIAAELVASQSGLGYRIQLSRLFLRSDSVVAGMLVIGILGVVMSVGLRALERRLTIWNGATLGTNATLGGHPVDRPATGG